MASAFGRMVVAFSGRPTDRLFEGCNYLIRNKKAVLISNSDDLIETMGWLKKNAANCGQLQLEIPILTESQQQIVDAIRANGPLGQDSISAISGIPIWELGTDLYELEQKHCLRKDGNGVYEVC